MVMVVPGFSQSTSIPELKESFRISAYFKSADYLSYETRFTFADSANPSNIIEQYTRNEKMSNGRYWYSGDSSENLQGFRYSVKVNLREKLIAVANPDRDLPVLQIPLLNKDFRKANMDTSYVVNLNDSSRVLKIFFKPESPYASYELTYDKRKALIRNIKYFLRNDYMGNNADGTRLTTMVNIQFINYRFDPFDQEIFNEDKFILRQDAQFNVQPAYVNYRLLSAYVDNQ
jgi:hypothetical protein